MDNIFHQSHRFAREFKVMKSLQLNNASRLWINQQSRNSSSKKKTVGSELSSSSLKSLRWRTQRLSVATNKLRRRRCPITRRSCRRRRRSLVTVSKRRRGWNSFWLRSRSWKRTCATVNSRWAGYWISRWWVVTTTWLKKFIQFIRQLSYDNLTTLIYFYFFLPPYLFLTDSRLPVRCAYKSVSTPSPPILTACKLGTTQVLETDLV